MRTTRLSLKRNEPLLYPLLLFIFSIVMYSSTLSHDFAFDDKSLIVENPMVQTTSSVSTIISSNYRYGVGFINEGLYRPLSMLTYVYNSPWNPSNPFPYHLFNVLFYACTVVAAFFLLLRITDSRKVAIFTSIVFLFHLHKEDCSCCFDECDFLILLCFLDSCINLI